MAFVLWFPTTAHAVQGLTSYYNLPGHKTASGQLFCPDALTAASKTLPFGTKLKLTNPKIDKSVIVRVNDRGPYVAGRVLDVTPAVATRLAFKHEGVASLRITVLSRPERKHTQASGVCR